MSFSSEVKEELAKQFGRSRHCQIAELAGILELEGMLDEEGKLVVSNENSLLQTKYGLLLQKIFGEKQEVLQIMQTLHWDQEPYRSRKINHRRADGMLVQQTCCKRAFIRGAFMAAGSISDPNKSYHFEIVCHTLEQAQQLKYDAPAIEKAGLPSYNWWNEGLHGLARSGTATMFPQAIGLAAMFDTKLVEKAGEITSEETRAKYAQYAKHGDRDIYKGLTI